MAEQGDHLKEVIDKASANLSQISAELDQVLATPYASMEENMSYKDFAKVNLNLAYTLNALYFNLLKTKGKVPEEHEVAQEMKLINTAFQKYEKVSEAKKEGPSTRVNKGAVTRVVNAALSGNK